MKRVTRFLGLLTVMALLVAAFGVAAQDEEDKKVLRTELGPSDVPTLDPALATDTSSIQVLNETYVGLTVLNEESLEVEPGLASDWEITENEDGTVTYTFNLREEVPWVRYNADSGEVEQVMDADGNPRYVTAQDFEYGWTRTLDPRTAGEYAYVLAPQVTGGNEFNTQELEEAEGDEQPSLNIGPETLGFEAVDDYTFEVTAPQFRAYHLNIYGMWMARPQPQWIIEETGDFWVEDENFQSYGPYALKEWNHDENLTITKNPFWEGTDSVPEANIDEVVFNFMEASTALAEYEAGNLDRLDTVSNPDIPRIKNDPELSEQYYEGTQAASYYYGFSVGIEPFTNVHMRRAFSYAIDRVDIVENVTRSGQIPAPIFSNPALAAFPNPENYEDLGIRYDPDKAQEEFEMGMEELGYESVEDIPAITLLFNTSENHRRIAEAIASMWEEELGVSVQLQNQEFGTYLDQRGNFPVYRAGWGADYPDAHNFLFDVFHSSSDVQDTGWTNEEFDSLVEEAAGLEDQQARSDLYAQAENLLVKEEAAIAPIYWYSDTELTKPYVDRTFSRVSHQRFEKWDINRSE